MTVNDGEQGSVSFYYCSDLKVILFDENGCRMVTARRFLTKGDFRDVILISNNKDIESFSAAMMSPIRLIPCDREDFDTGGGVDQPLNKKGDLVKSMICDPFHPGECIEITCPHLDEQHFATSNEPDDAEVKDCRDKLGAALCPPWTG